MEQVVSKRALNSPVTSRLAESPMVTDTESAQIHVLGPIQVSGGASAGLSRPAHKRLLAILTLDAGQRVSIDLLIDRFWPDRPPATAKASIQTHMSALRRAIGSEIIVTEGHGYRLDIDAALVDASRFLQLAGEVRSSVSSKSWPDVLRAADEALRLRRGRPYPELEDDNFARPTIVMLEETYLELLEMRFEALLELDRGADALPELESLTVEHPLRERLWEHLMTARYRLGRHTEALYAYRQISEQLADIGLLPGERLQRLEERVLLHDNALAKTRNNLPVELSSFVGRAVEIDNIGRLLTERRLVTLTGPGGSGKTRIALRVAREALGEFPDGVWIVELAPTHDAGMVATEIAVAMGLQPEGTETVDAIVGAIGRDRALIVLDNCEHLLEDIATTAQRLLEECSEMKLVATSREPLRLPGESIFEIPGMGYPLEAATDARSALEFEAVQLFVQRAGTADSFFVVTDANLPDVIRICERLDGMPLAIELAAARVRSLAVGMIADRLDDQLGLLTRGASTAPLRQRTLRGTIEWSYRLLTPDEQTVLNRLSVFRAAFHLDTAEHVISAPDLPGQQITPIILDLVDKSLVITHETKTEIKYRLLETVRQYAAHQLEQSGEKTAIEERHLGWYLGSLVGLWHRALGSGSGGLITELAAESGNLQAALEVATNRQNDPAVITLSQTLAWHWFFTGHLGITRTLLGSALEIADDRADIALMRALLARSLAYSEDVEGSILEAEAAHRLINDLAAPLLRAWVLASIQLGLFMSTTADPASMLDLAKEAEELAAGDEGVDTEIWARQLMADAFCWNGRTREGLAQQKRAIDLAEGTGDPLTIDRTYGHSIYNYMLDPVARRTAPMQAARRWLSLVQPGPDFIMSTASDWLPWIYMQAGEFDHADEAASWLGNRFLEGYNRSIYLMVTSSLSWMRGNLREARRIIEELATSGVNERWAHVYYPLAADVFADQGRLEDVREIADRYLSVEVHPTGEAAKLGVLNPLVRAEVDAAIESNSDANATRAKRAFERMQRILEDTPPKTESWTSVMTHVQNLAFAEAEMSRLTGSSPELWAKAKDAADYAYYRMYARWRQAEALLGTQDREAGEALLEEVDEEVTAMGAQLMRTRVKGTARKFQILNRHPN